MEISQKILKYIQQSFKDKKVIIFTDEKVKRLYGAPLNRYLKNNGIDSETTTNIDVNFDNSILVSIGGETVKKLSQEQKSQTKIHIPSTLYSMFFSNSEFTDQSLLKTLPQKQIKNALAHCIKLGVLNDNQLINHIDVNLDNILNLNQKSIETLINLSKTSLINLNQNSPEKLNYTNEFYLKIKKENPNLLHGYAQSLSLTLTNKIAVKRGLMTLPLHKKIKYILQKTGLPIVILLPPKIEKDNVYIPLFIKH